MQKKVNLLLFIFSLTGCLTFAQQTDSSKHVSYFSAAASITNNGISLIPSFSLNKPAAIFNMAVGKNRFSFEPEYAFSYEAKPWYFLFWFRYKIIPAGKFKMHAGTHLGLNFKNAVIPVDSDSAEVKVADRYLAGELAPSYAFTPTISVGIYYLHGRGLDPGSNRKTNFITLNAVFSGIRLSKQFYMKIVPQFFFLNTDAGDGFYFTSAFTVNRKNFPVSLSSVISKSIHTNIEGKDFVWNLSLNYGFNKKFRAL